MRVPPLADPAAGERGSGAVVLLVVIAVPLYFAAAVCCFLRYRRRHWVVWRSIGQTRRNRIIGSTQRTWERGF